MNNKNEWNPMPCPDLQGANNCQLKHYKHGNPSAIYKYFNIDGALFGYQRRFNLAEGDKDFCHLSYGNLGGKIGWYSRGLNSPFPLYGILKLKDRIDAPVLVVEGEKAADAAQHLLNGFITITSMNGSKSANKTDWSPLNGKDVVIWPDNDATGKQYAQSVAQNLIKIGAKSIKLVALTSKFPQGWDLADVSPPGVTLETLLSMIAGAEAFTPQKDCEGDSCEGVELPFRLTSTHLQVAEGKKNDIVWVNVCTRIEVVAKTSDAQGKNWGLVVKFHDPDQRCHQIALQKRMFAGEGLEYRQHLLDSGLRIESGRKSQTNLNHYLNSCNPIKKLESVDRLGWHTTASGRTFVLPDEKIGHQGVVFQAEFVPKHHYQMKGTLEEWNCQIAKYARGNSRVYLAICVAFAAPLLEFSDADSGVFHLIGNSSTGKTTALIVGASVWGGGHGHAYIHSWRATANGLEAVACLHNDTLLALDEMGQVDSKQLAEISYMLTNGSSKSRATKSGGMRRTAKWRTMVLSTGETGLADKIAETTGQTVKAGQEVRVIDIPADPGSGLGIFETLHGFSNGADLSNHLKDKANQFYGVPARRFLEEILAKDEVVILARVKFLQKEFKVLAGLAKSDGQVIRVLNRMALAAAAGELAIELGVLDLPKNSAIEALKSCFDAWLQRRGGEGCAEDAHIINQFKAFIEAHGEARFTPLKSDGLAMERVTYRRAGYRDNPGDGIHYYVMTEAMKEICKGYDLNSATNLLLRLGHLKPGDGKHRQVKIGIPGEKHPRRLYHILPSILEGDGGL